MFQSDSHVCNRITELTVYIKVERKLHIHVFVLSGNIFQCTNFHNKCVLTWFPELDVNLLSPDVSVTIWKVHWSALTPNRRLWLDLWNRRYDSELGDKNTSIPFFIFGESLAREKLLSRTRFRQQCFHKLRHICTP